MTQRPQRMDRISAVTCRTPFATCRARFSGRALAVAAAASAACLALPAVAPAAIVVQDAGAVYTLPTGSTLDQGITVSAGADVLVAVAEWRANALAPGFSYSGGSSTNSTFQTLWGNSADSTNNNVAISYLFDPTPGTSFNLSATADFNGGDPATIEYFTLSGVDTTVAATYNAVNSGGVTLNTTTTHSGFTTPVNNTTSQSLDFGTVTTGQFAVLVSQALNAGDTLAGGTNNGTLNTSFAGQIGSGNYFENDTSNTYGLNGVMLDEASSNADMTLTETESAANSDKWTTAGFVFTPLGTPEPASTALLGLGVASLLLSRRRHPQA